MKLIISSSLLLLSMFMFWGKSYSLTNNQIKNLCKKDKRQSTCIKNLQEKKSNLQKGNLIEIPVKPYRK